MLHPFVSFLASALLVATPLSTPLAAQSYKPSAPISFSGGSILSFELTPDGQWVVYLGDQEKNDLFRLYAVPADGSSRPRPLDRFVPFGDVREFRISPGGKRVVAAGLRSMQVADSSKVPRATATSRSGAAGRSPR